MEKSVGDGNSLIHRAFMHFPFEQSSGYLLMGPGIYNNAFKLLKQEKPDYIAVA